MPAGSAYEFGKTKQTSTILGLFEKHAGLYERKGRKCIVSRFYAVIYFSFSLESLY